MSNSSELLPTIDIALAAAILLTMDRYMLLILYVIGILGAVLNIITFVQRQIRTNSCSIYFLAAAVVDFGFMNIFILLEIITTFYKPLYTLIYATRSWCKIGNYIMLLLPCLSSTYLALASFDRFCASSLKATLRKWSQLKVSRIVVLATFITWLLFGLHILIVYDLIEDHITKITQCRVAIGCPTALLIIDGFFFSLFNGVIVPFLLCVFGLMILHNIKQSRSRVNTQPTHTNSHRTTTGMIPTIRMINPVQRRNDYHMLRMLLVQVFLTVILNLPYIVIYLFGYFNSVPRDLFLLLLYVIFNFIARWFYYMNYCKTFYINTLTSGLFRKSLRQQLITLFRRCGRRR